MIQAIVFLPLIGALIAGLFGRAIGAPAGNTSRRVCCSVGAFWLGRLLPGRLWRRADAPRSMAIRLCSVEVMRWIQSGDLDLRWALRIDTLTAVMLVVVNTVSASCTSIRSATWPTIRIAPRFFAYLSLFTFAMLMLVTSDNLLQMFFGWEGVGLASYLLIGFWYKKPSANAAAMKAFIVNRVGDFGFALGIFGVFVVFGSINFDAIFAALPTFCRRRRMPSMQLPRLCSSTRA